MKNYKLTVPVFNSNTDDFNREKTLKELKRCGAERVFLAATHFSGDSAITENKIKELKINVDFFKYHGFEVGIWIDSSYVFDNETILHRRNKEGVELGPRCPADEELLALSEFHVTEFAKIGADLIMFDDNFHFGLNRACYCDNHRRLFAEIYGDKYDFDEIAEKAFSDDDSEETKIMLAVTDYTWKNYARRIREAVDRVNPDVRIGICANIGNYGYDGATPDEISRIFAGKNKPFMRTIGSPYWDYYPGWPNRLSYAIELEREQSEMFKNSDIETMSEGDVFPRPRVYTSAASLECFDTMMIADGKSGGILKYMIDYYAPADYETGYIDAHIENEKLRNDIQDAFCNKISMGVRIYGVPDFLNPYGSFFSQLSIPTTYEGDGIGGAAFGKSAKYLDENALNKGIITDAVGAMYLMEKGIDVGLKSMPEKKTLNTEMFEDGIFFKTFSYKDCHYALEISDKAIIDSYYLEHDRQYWNQPDEMKKYPAAYRYENEKGQRFYVMALDIELALKDVLKECFRTYAKADQVMKACEWISKKTLPVKCYKYPDLYVMCKENEDSMAVGLWNLSKDKINAPKVYLDREYKGAEYINCTGTLDKKEVTLSKLYPFEFAGFVLKK